MPCTDKPIVLLTVAADGNPVHFRAEIMVNNLGADIWCRYLKYGWFILQNYLLGFTNITLNELLLHGLLPIYYVNTRWLHKLNWSLMIITTWYLPNIMFLQGTSFILSTIQKYDGNINRQQNHELLTTYFIAYHRNITYDAQNHDNVANSQQDNNINKSSIKGPQVYYRWLTCTHI